MKTIKTFLCLSFLLFSLLGAAQNQPFTFGIKAGAGLSSFNGDGVDNPEAKFGYNFGITVDYSVSDYLYFTSGLEYINKGAKTNYLYIDPAEELNEVIGKGNYTANYLQIPIRIGTKLDITDAVKCVLQAGPYFAYGIGGNVKITDVISAEYDDLAGKYDTFSDTGLKKFDFGMGFSTGVEVGKMNVIIGVDFGLININQLKNSDYPIRTQNAYLAVGYKF